MSNKAAILFSAIIPVLITLFLTSQGFSLIPQYEIKLNESTEENILKIKNIGLTQVKNVKAIFQNLEIHDVEQKSCIEGKISSENNYFEIYFEKMSRNIECEIIIFEEIDYGFDFTIIGDDVQGYNWIYSEWDYTGFWIALIFLMAIGWLVIIPIGLFIVLPIDRLAKFWRKRQFYKKREEPINEEISKIDSKLTSLKNLEKNPVPDNNAIELFEGYKKELICDKNYRKDRVDVVSDRTEFINEFFYSFLLVEKELIKIAKKYKINSKMVQFLPMLIIKKLKNDNLLSKEQVTQFESNEFFKDGIDNDFLYPSVTDLKNNINGLNSLLKILQNLKK